MILELIQSGYRLSGKRDKRLVRGLTWAVVEGAFTAAPYPLIYLLLRGVFAGTATTAEIIGYGLAMLACLVARVVAGVIATPLIFTGAYAMMSEARLRIADRLRKLPMGWFGAQRSGDLGARLTGDLELVENLWSHFLGIFAGGLAMPLFLLLFLAFVDWRLALLVLAVMPVALVALWWTQRVAQRPVDAMFAANSAAQSELTDYVQGIAVIRGFGRFGAAWERLQKVLETQHRAALTVESRPAPWLAGFGFALETGFVLLALIGAVFWRDGSLAPVVWVAFLVLALPIYRQIFDLGLSIMLLRFGSRALSRIEVLLDTATLPEPTRTLSPDEHDIEFRGVTFAYDTGAPVLDGVDCVMPANALTAIVGESGAGKSTMVHLLARLWDVQAGSIRIGGVDLRDIGTEALHRHVAMVFQDVVLFSGSVIDNLRIGRPNATFEEIVTAAKRAQADTFIRKLPQGYDTVLDENGGSLSGGERQRLSIARALLKDAPILLLDEATASVDPSAEAELQRAIGALVKGRTVVTIAHRLGAIRHAHQILVMAAGRIVERGRHDELLARNGRYAAMWARQQSAKRWSLARQPG